MAFRVGQKVVCVDDQGERWDLWRDRISFPVRGSIYTIRDIGPPYNPIEDSRTCLRLNEIRNPSVVFGEPNFFIGRFRPVVERKTDTGFAILKEILDGLTGQNDDRAAGKPTTRPLVKQI